MKLISKFQNGGLYSGQSGFYRNDKPDDAVLNFFSDVKNKIQQSLSNINIAGPSKGSAQLKLRNSQYFNKPEIKSTKPIKSTINTSNQQTNKQTVYKSKYDKKDDNFEGGSKKEVTVTATRSKPKTQVTTPTKQNTTAKFKEEVKTEPKQTYLKPKGEVNSKVAEWQKKLKNEGFDVGKIDGKWGKKTEAAYQDYIKNKERLEKVGFPEDNVPFVEARQGFPTPESAYLKKGGKMEFIYLQKGGKINGKVNPNDGDENAIPTKEEGGTDMNPKFTKKLKPKQTTKPSPIYKPKAKTEKVEEKKKGGKMRKKCSCGCAMKISKNEKGGLIEACACKCGGKIKKKINKGQNGLVLKNDATYVAPKTYRQPYRGTSDETDEVSKFFNIIRSSPKLLSEKLSQDMPINVYNNITRFGEVVGMKPNSELWPNPPAEYKNMSPVQYQKHIMDMYQQLRWDDVKSGKYLKNGTSLYETQTRGTAKSKGKPLIK